MEFSLELPSVMRLLIPLLAALRICLAAAYPGSAHDEQVAFDTPPTKRIAIVGTGAAGIGTLKAIMDLDEELRRGWTVVAFEERVGVGGIWCV